MNPIDRDIADAFAALDRAVGDEPAEDLAGRVLIRLDQPDPSEADLTPVEPPAPAPPPAPDDTGRHDIIELANHARRRISQRENSEADGDDSAVLLTAAHGGLRAVALPDPSRGRIATRPGVATIRPATAGDAGRADARTSAPFWILGSVATLAAAAAVAVFVFGIGRPRPPTAVEGAAGGPVAHADPAAASPAPLASPVPPAAAAEPAAPPPAEPVAAAATPPAPAAPVSSPDEEPAVKARSVARSAPPRESTRRDAEPRAAAAAAEPVPEKSPAAADPVGGEATAAPVAGGGTVSLEDMLDDASGRVKAPSAAEVEKRRQALEEAQAKKELDRRDVTRTLGGIRGDVQRCGALESVRGTVAVKFVVAPGGEVSSAAATGAHAQSRTGGCVAAAVKQARFPAFEGAPVTITFPFVLDGAP